MGALGTTTRPLCGLRAHHDMRVTDQGYKTCIRCGVFSRDGIPVDVRFWSYVQKGEECWVWTGTPDEDGYGRFGFRGRSRPAHSVAWELSGRIRPNFKHRETLDHKCDNKLCVRPDHLRILPLADNASRANKKPVCKRGHLMKGQNLYFYTTKGRKRRRCRACMRLRKASF